MPQRSSREAFSIRVIHGMRAKRIGERRDRTPSETTAVGLPRKNARSRYRAYRGGIIIGRRAVYARTTCKGGVAPSPNATVGDSLGAAGPSPSRCRPAPLCPIAAAPRAGDSSGARAHAWKIV